MIGKSKERVQLPSLAEQETGNLSTNVGMGEVGDIKVGLGYDCSRWVESGG